MNKLNHYGFVNHCWVALQVNQSNIIVVMLTFKNRWSNDFLPRNLLCRNDEMGTTRSLQLSEKLSISFESQSKAKGATLFGKLQCILESKKMLLVSKSPSATVPSRSTFSRTNLNMAFANKNVLHADINLFLDYTLQCLGNNANESLGWTTKCGQFWRGFEEKTGRHVLVTDLPVFFCGP